MTKVKKSCLFRSKNNTEVEKLPELAGHYQLLSSNKIPRALYTLTERPREDDYGNYTCQLKDDSDSQRSWQVRARTVAKLAANTNVVEGQKLKLQCKVSAPPPPLTLHPWSVSANPRSVCSCSGARTPPSCGSTAT